MQFGKHVPQSEHKRSQQTPMQVFSRGLQVPGSQWKFHFPNGYGASVISDGYGAEQGKYELAVLNPNGELDYSTHITDDVLGYLSEADVAAALDEIEAL